MRMLEEGFASAADMALAEIVVGRKTTQRIVERAREIVTALAQFKPPTILEQLAAQGMHYDGLLADSGAIPSLLVARPGPSVRTCSASC
jgi:hypothetical protein